MNSNEHLRPVGTQSSAGNQRPSAFSISMVKNEQDVIEAFVRHNIRFLDFMVIVDNGSVDRTVPILLQLAEEFDNLILAEEAGFAYSQSERMTRWLHTYQARFHADFIFLLDADEFLDEDGASFSHALQEVPRGGYGQIPWCTYVLTPDHDLSKVPDPLRAMNFRRRTEVPPRFKAVLRLDGEGAEDFEITQGNHAVSSRSGRQIAGIRLHGLRLLHYPLRSLDQAKSKSVVGWMAYLAIDPRVSESKRGHQWRVNCDEFLGDQAIDFTRLCEMSMLYTQDSRPIDWTRDAVLEPCRLVYERRYSNGEALEATQLIARSWELSITGSRRHSPSIELSTLGRNRLSGDGPGLPLSSAQTAAVLEASPADTAAETLVDLIEQGRTADAIQLLESALVVQQTAELWNDWATLQCGTGDLTKAKSGYRHALRMDPFHRQAGVNLAVLLIASSEFSQAMDVVRRHTIILTEPEREAISSLAAPLLAGSSQSFSIEQLITPPAKKKFLVIVRAGDSSLHPTWLLGEGERTWDLIVHSYGERCPWSSEDGVEIIRATGDDIIGPKMRAMHSLYQQRRDELLAYDFVCFADDDLATSLQNFNSLFRMCAYYDLELAQPALTHDSFMGAWGITMENRSFLLRFTNFVEVMCPVFSRGFLELCAPTFLENVSGYGLDILWSSWVSSPWKIGIVDACPVRHSRMSFSGQLYKTFREMGVNPDQELIDLIQKWQLVRPEEQIPGQVVVPAAINHGGILLDQSRIATCTGHGIDLLRALLNGLPPELANDHNKAIRLLFPTMQQTLQRYGLGDPDPDRLAVEKIAASSTA